MFYVVNLERRTVLTYPEGDRIVYGSRDHAADAAQYAQELTSDPHAVTPLDSPINARLGNVHAPWVRVK